MKQLLVIAASILAFTAAHAQQTPVKEWTFLVYMNADNNLYQDGLNNIKQMQKVGSTPELNIVVELDPEPRGLPTQRMLVNKNVNPTILQTIPETDMGDFKHFADFVSWGIQTFPARHYAVVVWNHGDGWQGVSYDDNPSHHMTIPQMAAGLRMVKMDLARRGFSGNGPLIDILNFDACLMSSIEVAYEMKDLTRVMIGSQFNEPGAGEDYSTLLAHLVQNPKMSINDLATQIVYEYVKQFPNDANINYLALDMAKVPAFTQMFRNVAIQHLGAPSAVQSQLHHFYQYDVTGTDLIGVITGARKIGAKLPPLATALDQMITAYGYPSERTTTMTQTQLAFAAPTVHIERPYAAVVNFRSNSSGAWQHQNLTLQADGFYAIDLPKAAVTQYVVQRLSPNFSQVVGQEALTTYLRGGQNPIIFHTQFPQSSPVIAEAHTAHTDGAMGMSIYLGGSTLAKMQGHPANANGVLTEYMQLQFAQNGAPEWTRFMGYK